MLIYDPVTFNKNITKNAYLAENILNEVRNVFGKFDSLIKNNENIDENENLVRRLYGIEKNL